MRPPPWTTGCARGGKAWWARRSQFCCKAIPVVARVRRFMQTIASIVLYFAGGWVPNEAIVRKLAAWEMRKLRANIGAAKLSDETWEAWRLRTAFHRHPVSSSSTCFGYTLGPATAHDARLARGLPCPSLGGARGGGVGRDGADNIRKQADGRQDNRTTSWTRSVALPGGRRLPAETAGDGGAPLGRGTRWGA